MTVNNEGEKIWKEEVLAFDKTDYHHSAGGDNLKQRKAPVETVNHQKQTIHRDVTAATSCRRVNRSTTTAYLSLFKELMRNGEMT
jgi:hypothetical protein